MLIAHQIALDLNNVQATYMARATGTARFAYNWALAEWQRQYEAHRADESLPKPGQLALHRQLNAIKREQFPGLLEVTKNAPQMAIIQLGQALAENQGGVGVDLGVSACAALSTGEVKVGPKPHKALLKRLGACRTA